MKMKKNIVSFAVLFLSLAACTNKNNVKITGNIQEGANQRVYLEQLNVDNAILIDSTDSDKKGRFSFKTAVTSPTFFNIKIGPKEFITFIAAPDEKIELSGTYQDLTNNYWVDGSENSLWIKLLNYQLHATQIMMDSLKKNNQRLVNENASVTERERLIKSWDSIINKQINFSKDFILKHAISPASYYALYQKFDPDNFILTPEENLQSYKIVASSLKAMYPESQYTKAILKHLEQINKGLQNAKILQLIANSKTTLPAVRLPNLQGDTIALSEVKGKFIVLDFTVLSAQGSEAYINDMKNIYNKFHSQGVQIYQVCLDENRLLWERLVKRYQIPWTCVWDSDGLKSRVAKMWNIQSVPANYIIGPDSAIVGKNLNGRRLEERLNDLISGR